MTTYVLIHGAATDAWYWHLVGAELRELGHEVIAPDLPCDDESAGLGEYADTVLAAMGGAARDDVVVVGHSFAGFTAPLVCERVGAQLLVMLQAQIPTPGESPGQWWTTSGYGAARAEQDRADAEAGKPGPDDEIAFALHETPPELADEAVRRGRDQAGKPFESPWPLAAWPDVPTRVLIARDDRFFPAGFMRRLAWDRLGIAADEIPGDHVPMLSYPRHVVERLEAYRTAHAR